jgi:hypothetical protein
MLNNAGLHGLEAEGDVVDYEWGKTIVLSFNRLRTKDGLEHGVQTTDSLRSL